MGRRIHRTAVGSSAAAISHAAIGPIRTAIVFHDAAIGPSPIGLVQAAVLSRGRPAALAVFADQPGRAGDAAAGAVGAPPIDTDQPGGAGEVVTGIGGAAAVEAVLALGTGAAAGKGLAGAVLAGLPHGTAHAVAD